MDLVALSFPAAQSHPTFSFLSLTSTLLAPTQTVFRLLHTTPILLRSQQAFIVPIRKASEYHIPASSHPLASRIFWVVVRGFDELKSFQLGMGLGMELVEHGADGELTCSAICFLSLFTFIIGARRCMGICGQAFSWSVCLVWEMIGFGEVVFLYEFESTCRACSPQQLRLQNLLHVMLL
jgi:hypothetical protein